MCVLGKKAHYCSPRKVETLSLPTERNKQTTGLIYFGELQCRSEIRQPPSKQSRAGTEPYFVYSPSAWRLSSLITPWLAFSSLCLLCCTVVGNKKQDRLFRHCVHAHEEIGSAINLEEAKKSQVTAEGGCFVCAVYRARASWFGVMGQRYIFVWNKRERREHFQLRN